ncbi:MULTISPECIES: hypothetical protein [Deinococcus]|uniref:Zinc finger motif protein n=1 Tax=Deinococcus sedimenti TaxID=1867090 RepID=A0ABQ2S2J7_9DEIO|nr:MULTISPECIES: hypothetical protein [Deinococcus]MDK2011621.1 hypothetical protein [Deinococcus sp. 43]GGB72531.1 hypothetical protein GCM10008019_30920 [Deinococcus soli (ex Cha et al. 2016)]GGR84183.1 hypothetical protein GCM10008960_09050 [Deinococcus sedimenti]
MATLEIDCPICAEVLELTDQDRAELQVGDVIVCSSCHSEMEVTRNDGGEDFELELLGAMTTCPNCDEEFEVTAEMLQAAPMTRAQDGVEVALMTCPHCRAKFELELADEEG